jgi:DNA-binding transcriptional MocR family regulator
VELRHRLLELAEQEHILLLEDNPYGLFHAGQAHAFRGQLERSEQWFLDRFAALATDRLDATAS